MLNCGDEIAQLNGWDYKNDPDRVDDSRNLHRSKFNWETQNSAPERVRCKIPCGRAWKNCARCGQTNASARMRG